jgi:hypothetical protein
MNKLSPATHAVLDAYTDAPMSGRVALAAALRVAAGQLDHPTSAHTLYAFADELEAQ